MGARTKSGPSLLGLPLAAILATAACVVIPFSWLGIPSGHDFEFHLNSWLEVLAHWKEGVLYPHWAALAHYGYGEARFIFYPPISWVLGAILGALLPWKLVPAGYIWIALTLCGSSMFLLARRWLSRNDALLSAIVYAANPYHLVIVYWRSDMAELLASALLPLLLLCILRIEEDGWSSTALLSLVLAAGWLTNVPTAIMMHYSLGLLMVWLAISKRSWAIVGYGASAVLFSALIAAVYLLPVLHQQHRISLSQVLAPGVRPVDNFLFTVTPDVDHNRFNRLASEIALSQILFVSGLLFFSRRWRGTRLWQLLAAWGLMCMVLMHRLTLVLWMHLPELRYVQFPWRWMLCVSVVFSLALVMASQRNWIRVAMLVLAIAPVFWVWQRILPPWWDNSGDIQEMADNQQDRIGNEGVDEYVPAGVDPYDADQNAPLAKFQGNNDGELRIEKWDSEKRVILAEESSPGRLVLRLFNYPSWKVRVNGGVVRTETVPHTGQMVVPLAAGKNRIVITFSEGWDRWLGAAISAFGLWIAGFLYVKSRHRFASQN